MREYGFSLTLILPYKDEIYDFVLTRENTGQWKYIFSHILCSENVWFCDVFREKSKRKIRKKLLNPFQDGP